MFGDSVMWFALIDTNGEKPTRVLELPSLVDMLDSGSRGVLANGWIVRLANGVKKLAVKIPALCETLLIAMHQIKASQS